ncbi:hypothetical protein [Marinimicrobium alkaliphilum]|uniref:hypothetical protein n=1 Tax=Marinimicrobium alkaliphilum TaxID=2202654 RepID=UPI000DBA7F06|nr:hypothetical protein [Marinimicrobium alkaliphilum]
MKPILRRTTLVLALLFAVSAAAADLDATFAPYANLLNGFLQERQLDDGGLVSAFDYAAAWEMKRLNVACSNRMRCLPT